MDSGNDHTELEAMDEHSLIKHGDVIAPMFRKLEDSEVIFVDTSFMHLSLNSFNYYYYCHNINNNINYYNDSKYNIINYSCYYYGSCY